MYQDSGEMKNIAEEIRSNAAAFDRTRAQIFNALDYNIGEAESHNAWYGPQAEAFYQNFKAKEKEFVSAYNNIISIANNLESQAQGWDRFEGV